MVAYSFNRQFIEPIRTRTKTQTLRNPRARHARAWETLQLYTAMRTKACRLIGTATCRNVALIRLDLDCGRVEFPETGRALTTIDELDAFAAVDGFPAWRQLVAFWAANHPGVSQWEGVQIAWGETFVEAAP